MTKNISAYADRTAMRQALSALDDIATSDGGMSSDDIDSLTAARELLADRLDLTFNEDTNRYTDRDDSDRA